MPALFLKIKKLPILTLSFRLPITLLIFDWIDDLSVIGIVWCQLASFVNRLYHLAPVAPICPSDANMHHLC